MFSLDLKGRFYTTHSVLYITGRGRFTHAGYIIITLLYYREDYTPTIIMSGIIASLYVTNQGQVYVPQTRSS